MITRFSNAMFLLAEICPLNRYSMTISQMYRLTPAGTPFCSLCINIIRVVTTSSLCRTLIACTDESLPYNRLRTFDLLLLWTTINHAEASPYCSNIFACSASVISIGSTRGRLSSENRLSSFSPMSPEVSSTCSGAKA